MKKPFLPLFLCLALAVLFSACQKSEQSSPPTSPAAPGQPAPKAAPARAATPRAQPPAELKLKWPVGNRYVYRIDVTNDFKFPQMPNPMHQEVGMSIALTVLKESETGGHQIEMEFLGQEMEMKMGDQVMMSFDSKGDAANDAQNPMAGPFRKMVGSKLRYMLNAENQVEKIEELDAFINKILAGANPAIMGQLKQMLNEDYFKQMTDFGRGIPGKSVNVGESWSSQHEVGAGWLGRMVLDLNHTLTGWEEREKRNCAVLNVKGAVKSTSNNQPGPFGKMTVENGKMSGKSWFDPELGVTVESALDQSMDLKIEASEQLGGGPGSQPVGGNMTQKIAFKLVDLSKATK